MPSFTTQRPVPFSAQQMYALVADVERYPEFLPMCTGLVINERVPTDGGERLIARMSVGYKTIRESFITRVELQPTAPQIDVAYLDGPFKHLNNRWRFLARPDGGSIVDFYITYEFKNALLGVMVGAMFDQAFRKFSEAFERRAEQVYGQPKTA